MKATVMFGVALLTAGLFVGCDRARQMGRGFILPEGDAMRGRDAYIALGCCNCHRVEGAPELPGPVVPIERVVVLGGKVVKVRTYGDLVTAIIHPNYEMSGKLVNRGAYAKSPMRAMNEKMTVRQLVDIVTFLQPQYQQLEPVYPTAAR